jgi:putative Holliday junction resolvase
VAVKALASAAPAGTVLAFDFGMKRIGVAVGETATRTAHPLLTLANRGAILGEVAVLIAEWRPVLLLVGLPTHADGTPHTMTARARGFASRLRGQFPLPVQLVDERFTTREASSALREASASATTRKDARDAIAAQIMLQAYLDQRAS